MASSRFRAFALFVVFLTTCAAVRADGSAYATKSVLAEGKWVKVSVKETGIYKLTYAELKKMGFSNPEKVSIHGYGGWPLEEDFSKAIYLDDVPSTEIWRGDDYVLFYGKGTVKWTADTDKKTFTHENNAYSTLGYYFLTDATEPKVMASVSGTGNAIDRIDTYDDYQVHELDKYSLTMPGRPNSGRELFGESFDVRTTQNFQFLTPGITNDTVRISFRFAAKIMSGFGILSLSANGTVMELSQNRINQNTSTHVAAVAIAPEAFWVGEKNENTTLSLSFSLSQQTSHLDYIRFQSRRQLQPYGACTFFRSFASLNRDALFVIKNASSNVFVFDVTDGQPVQRIETSLNGSELSFSIPANNQLREFALVDVSKTLPAPLMAGEVKPQNLHGIEQTDLIIVAPEAFIAEAERLAAFRRTNDNLTVAVVNQDDVFNEFASGMPEATAIRRFMKMFYDRKTVEADAPKYLLLFGDGRYDNRKLTDVWKNSSDNYIVTYQTKETLNETSYVTDDYFGFLLDREGANPVSATLCIGIGRFPVNSYTEARNAVDKVISYAKDSKAAPWKNKIGFVADDGNAADNHSTEHAYQIDDIAEYIENNHPAYISRKLYFDAFKKSMTGGKPSYPDIRTNIHKELKEGLLIFNYMGHGDAVSWAEEKVMTQADINGFTYTNLPLWVVSACDIAPFDAPTTSAGEDVFLNRKSGGIALISTTRVAYSKPNARFHTQVIKYLFEKRGGRHLTLGDVMRYTKNDLREIELMSFVLLGDPSMTLTYPDEYRMGLTEINGKKITNEPINIKAFEMVNAKGNVYDTGGALANSFNGLLSVTVFDSREQITSLNNNRVFDDDGNAVVVNYFDYPNLMYIGNDSIRDGAFSFSFTVPKDISYSYQNGKISLYAVDELHRKEANGFYKNFTVGGTSDIIVEDEEGPEIRALYLNTPEFKDGDKVNATPLFTAIVWDKSGINVGSSSIGHDIMLTIDNNPVLSFSLNSYYRTYLIGENGEGIIKFPIPELESGRHTAEFKVWDIHNNSTTQSFSFVVTDNYKPTIVDLTAGPSPAVDHVNFLISHDLPESTVHVEIQVFDMAGRMQWNYRETGSSDLFDAYRIRWNLMNGSGARLHSGIYVYRVIIRSAQSQDVSKSKKLIILAQ